MKLSIITINLNNAAGLEKTAESIVCQTFTDFEWIVIDGGSTDGSVDVIRRYADRIAYWVSEKDSGIYNAMNKGVKVVNGEYVQFLNSGDWLASATILNEIFLNNNSEDVIYGDINCYKDSRFGPIRKYPRHLSVDFMLVYSICHNSCFVKCDHLMNNPFDENLRIVSDWKFFMLEILKNASFKHVDKCVIFYDVSGISETMSGIEDSERNAVLDELYPEIIEYKIKQSRTVSSFLANTTFEEFTYLCQHHKFLKKVITAIVLLMKKL